MTKPTISIIEIGRIPSDLNYHCWWKIRIDNKFVGYLSSEKIKRFSVLPGKHVISVKWDILPSLSTNIYSQSINLHCIPNTITKLECGCTDKGVILDFIEKRAITPIVKTYDIINTYDSNYGVIAKICTGFFITLTIIFFLWSAVLRDSDIYKKIVYPQEYWKNEVESLMYRRLIMQKMSRELLQDLLIEHSRNYSDKTEMIFSATNAVFEKRDKELNEQIYHAREKALEHGYDGEFIPLNERIEQRRKVSMEMRHTR